MTQTIELVAADGHRLAAYLAEPSTPAVGALVVVQEIFGVNAHIRGVADRFAQAGYHTIAPALFDRVQRGYESGYTADDVQAGRGLMGQVTWDNAAADVAAAVEAVRGAGKVSVVGYCWGGAVAWYAAARVPGLAAAVAYYGGSIPTLIYEQPQCPVMLHFGEKDASIPLDKAQAVAKAHPQATVHYYPAAHGFNCEARGSYDAAASELARERTLEFLQRHLVG